MYIATARYHMYRHIRESEYTLLCIACNEIILCISQLIIAED